MSHRRVPSGSELVRYGLQTSQVCVGLASKISVYNCEFDDNLVPYVHAYNRRWYMNCSGMQEDYWADEANGDKKAAGLLASTEWKELRPFLDDPSQSPLLVISLQRCQMRRNGGASWFEASRGKIYSIVKNERELFEFYNKFPPADRFAEEIILPSTPHKMFFDIEKDLDDASMGEAEMIEHLMFLRSTLVDKFIPFLCQFYQEKLGIQLEERDCYVLDSSQLAVKFSTHVTVTTPQHHYFATRTESWVAMVALMKFMNSKATTDPEFKSWLFYRCAANKERCVWDFGIYGSGSRNMRLIGACKAKNQLVGTAWEKCRVFQPIQQQENAEYHNFISSAYGYRQKVVIPVTSALIREGVDFTMEMRIASPHWFVNSRGFASRIVKTTFVTEEDKEYIFGLMGRDPASVSFGGGNAVSHGLSADVRDVDIPFALVMQAIRQSRNSNNALEEEVSVYTNFMNKVVEHLTAIGTALHPSNNIRVEVVHTSDHIAASVRMGAWVRSGPLAGKRRCWFGCTQGSHEITLSCRPDFSVEYFCYACKQRADVVRSPIRIGSVVPRASVSNIPVDFKHSVIDYSLIAPNADEDSVHMRKIRCLNESGSILGAKSTTILQGPMGTGKTVAVCTFLAAVRAKHPQASVLAISFRKMLASMFANAFKLQNYAESEEHCLYDQRQLAIQLESLERLGQQEDADGDMGMYMNDMNAVPLRYRAQWDVVILDEVESVLSHFSSSTMRDRLFVIWKLFYAIVSRCNSLVVCDADIGARTFQFLRMARKRRVPSGVIPNLQYHLNHHIAIRTRFIDYAGLVEWKDMLIATLLEGKRVFMFSNHKAFMHRLLRYINETLEEKRLARIAELRRGVSINDNNGEDQMDFDEEQNRPRRRRRVDNGLNDALDAIENDPVLTEIHNIMEHVLLIDADISESEKKTLSNCNEEWIKYRFVMISPTVGAGIDFTVPHFHKTFGYAIHNSCCARSINQMRGRCRKTLDNECHMYIADNIKYDLMNEEEREISRDVGLPITLDDALFSLNINRQCYQRDMTDVCDAMDNNGESIITTSVALVPTELKMLLALNDVETNRSKTCFRAEWIAVLQKGDPDLVYEFRNNMNLLREQQFTTKLLEMETKHRSNMSALVAVQDDLSRINFTELRAQDMRGTMVKSTPDASDYDRLQKNKIKFFYGINDNVSPTVWAHLFRIAGSTKTMDHVRNIAFIIGRSTGDLYNSAIRSGSLKSVSFRMIVADGNADVMTVSQRKAQEVWPGDHVVRLWTVKLMYACGFHADMGNLEPNSFALDPAELLSGEIGASEALKHVGMERLEEPEMQQWLNERHMYIKTHSGIKSSKANAPENGEWEWKHVTTLMKQFMQVWFGLLYRKGPPASLKKAVVNASVVTINELDLQEPSMHQSLVEVVMQDNEDDNTSSVSSTESSEENIYHYSMNNKRFFKMKVDKPVLRTMLSLTYCYLRAPYSGRGEEPAARIRAREQITKLMVDNNIEQLIQRFVSMPTPEETSREARSAPEVNEAKEEEDEVVGGYGGYSGYGYGGCSGYGGEQEEEVQPVNFAVVDEDDGHSTLADVPLNYMDEEGSEGLPVIAEGNEEEEEDDDGTQNYGEDEESQLAAFETLDDRDLKKRRACAISEVKKAEKPGQQEQIMEYRRRVVQRYIGAPLFQLQPLEFVSEMLSEAYQMRIKRMRDVLIQV